MNILWIDACIRKQSRTRALCTEYLKKRYGNADTVTERSLTKMSLVPLNEKAILNRDSDCRANDFSAGEYTLAKELAGADELVIAAPYWDCSFPSALKVYFEHVCVNGITFAYGVGGALIKKCHAKRLVYITTAGGYFAEQNSVKLYLQELCTLFGIEELQFFSAQGLDIQANNAEKILQQACEDVCRAAESETEQ